VIGHRRPVLTGRARYRDAVRVTAEYPMGGGMLSHRFAPGAVLHPVAYADRSVGTAGHPVWCGPLTNSSIRGSSNLATRCVVRAPRGYEVVATAQGPSWMAEHGAVGTGEGYFEGPIAFEPVDLATLEPMVFELKWARSGRDGVEVEAVARRDRESVRVSRGRVPFDAVGRAIVPFWTHRLTLTRSGRDVTAALTADGDGTGFDFFAEKPSEMSSDDVVRATP